MTKSLEALIASEIADFFCGFVEIHTELGGPNTIDEAQQQLTERVTRIASECEAALIAALEQLQNDEVHQRLANAEHQLHMAELAKHNLKASRKAQFRKRLAAERRVAELEQQLIKPLPIGELIQRLEGQTYEKWIRASELCVKSTDAMREVAPLCVKLPDGWVMVPVEPTESMVIEGFESEPNENFSEPETWEAYQEMSGCQQAAHKAELCWAAMIAAAPQPDKCHE